jgi:hypothetical protein
VASVAADASHKVIFFYPAGAQMVGASAPGPGWPSSSTTTAKKTSRGGVDLLDAAIDWMLR